MSNSKWSNRQMYLSTNHGTVHQRLYLTTWLSSSSPSWPQALKRGHLYTILLLSDHLCSNEMAVWDNAWSLDTRCLQLSVSLKHKTSQNVLTPYTRQHNRQYLRFNILRPGQNEHYLAEILKCIFFNGNFRISIVILILTSNEQWFSNVSGNGLVLNKRHAVTWNNVGINAHLIDILQNIQIDQT